MSVSLDSRAPWRLLAGVAAILLMAGCTAEDGDTGAQGPPGPPAIVGKRTVPPEELNPKITDVSVSSPMVVDFQVTDERGFAVVGVDSADFTVSKLVPGSDGETDNWFSYIRADDGGTQNQGDNTSDGTLEDHGNGTYTFTFAEDLEDISSAAGTDFEPELTHRVGIELRGVTIMGESVPAGSNAVYDFQPSTGKTSGIRKREIVKQETCQTCHGPEAFSAHGGPRKDVRYCVACHQKDSTDGQTGNTIDFRVMIHKIHAGSPDAEYCGFGCSSAADAHSFDDVEFPQDVRNCTNCHDPDDPDTPQASNVNNKPTAATCLSCHEDAEVVGADNTLVQDGDGIAATNHAGGAQPNSTCATCHSEGGLIGPVLAEHEIPEQVWAERFNYNIVDITSPTAPGSGPTVQFSVTDPTTSGEPAYDLENSDAFDGSRTSLSMLVAWPTSDYTNVANDTRTDVTGSLVSRPISITLVGDFDDDSTTPPTLNPNINSLADNIYQLDTSSVGVSIPDTSAEPRGALGSGAVVIEGPVSGDFDGDNTYDDRVPVTSAVDYFAITDSSVQARREVVDPAKCQVCHSQNDGLAFHGDNRTDNTQVCVVCHNPNQTDLNRRPAEAANGGGAVDGSNPNTVDGFEDQSVDFKYMIHAIHGSEARVDPADGGTPYVAYGFGDNPHDYSDAGFPRPASDCLACHREGTYELALGDNVLATTVSSRATWEEGATADDPDVLVEETAGAATDPTDDHNVSATAAVCSSCHSSDWAADHMDRDSSSGSSFGNAFLLNPDTQANIDTALDSEGGENCVLCHGPGSIASVAEEHGVE